MVDVAPSDVLSLLIAASSDDKKVARLEELNTALESHKAQMNALSADVQKQIAEAAAMKHDAEEISAGHDARQAALDDREKTLSDTLTSMNAEKTAFAEVRQNIERDQADKRDQLAALESALSHREAAVTDRETAVTAREQAADEAQSKYEGLVASAKKLLELETTTQ